MAGRAMGTKVKTCPHCKGRFELRREDQIFCETPCRLAFHAARHKRLMKLGEEVEKAAQ